MLAFASHTVSDQPTIYVPRTLSVSSHNNTILSYITCNTECVETELNLVQTWVLPENVLDKLGANTSLKIYHIDEECLASSSTSHTSTDQAVTSSIKLDIVVRKSCTIRPNRVTKRIYSSRFEESVSTLEYDRIQHITSLTVNAFDLFELTIDEVHDTVLSSHTTNMVSRTWFVGSEVILDVRDYPVVLQRVTAISASWEGVILFLTYDRTNDVSSVTNELECIVPSRNTSNRNFAAYWESSWVKNHLVAFSFVTKSVLNSWVIVRIVLNDSYTRNSNACSEVFVLERVSYKSSEVLISNDIVQFTSLSSLDNCTRKLWSITVHNFLTLNSDLLTYLASWSLRCVNKDTTCSILDPYILARNEVNYTRSFSLSIISQSANLCDGWDILTKLSIESTSACSIDFGNFLAREISIPVPTEEAIALFVRSVQYELSCWLSRVSKTTLPIRLESVNT